MFLRRWWWGRIRTFEVDDGRFTVCSLWPLGNPTGVKSHCRLFSKMNGGGGRITRRYLSSPFGAIACGNVLSLALESNLSRRFLPFPLSANIVYACRGNHITVVNNGGGEGFEPSKSMTADLQSAPFGRREPPHHGVMLGTGLLPSREAGRIIPNDAPL